MFFFVFADIHTEAVQAALAKHKEEKMALPMPTKRRSTYVPSPIETRTPPGRKRAREVPRGCSVAEGFSHLLLFLAQTRRRVPKTSPRCPGSRRGLLRLPSMQTCTARRLGSAALVRARPLPPPPRPRCPTGKPSLSLSPSRSTNPSTSPCISLSTSLSTNVTTSSTSSLQLQ